MDLHRMLGILASVWILISIGSCTMSDGDDGTDPFFNSCETVPEPTKPSSPATCSGPDADGWTNGTRPDGAEPCPAPPSDGCSQVVIGRQFDTEKYIDCPGYIVLHRTDWTLALNDQFIACVFAGELGTCDPPAIVVSERADVPDYSEEDSTVTSRELCQLNNSGCTVTFADSGGPGYIVCKDNGKPSGFAGSCQAGQLQGTACYNYLGSSFDPAQVELMCTTQYGGGTYSDSPCTTTNAMGACRLFINTPNEYVMVYYWMTSDPVEMEEMRQGMAESCADWPSAAGGPGQWQSPYVPPD